MIKALKQYALNVRNRFYIRKLMRLASQRGYSEKQVCDQIYLGIRQALINRDQHLWKEFSGLMSCSDYTIQNIWDNFSFVTKDRIDPDNPLQVNITFS